MRQGRRLAAAEIGEQDAVLLHHRIGLVADIGAERAVLGLRRCLQAAAGDVEQPAVEGAAQAAILEPAIGEIGTAVRTVPSEQAVAALLVAEQDEILAEQAQPFGRTRALELVHQRRRLPIAAQQCSGRRARPGAGDEVVLLGTQHDAVRFEGSAQAAA
jgi:hypothetical protein